MHLTQITFYITYVIESTLAKLLKSNVPFGKGEVITSKMLGSPLWLGWPLWNIGHNDNRYVPFIVSTSQSFTHSRLYIGFVTKWTRQSASSGSGSTDPSGAPEFTPVFSGTTVTRSFALYVYLVDRCFCFCTFSFRHCVVCYLIYGFWLPLWSLQTLLSKVIELLTIASANIWIFQD